MRFTGFACNASELIRYLNDPEIDVLSMDQNDDGSWTVVYMEYV